MLVHAVIADLPGRGQRRHTALAGDDPAQQHEQAAVERGEVGVLPGERLAIGRGRADHGERGAFVLGGALHRPLEFGPQLEHPGRLGAGEVRAVGHAVDLGREVGLRHGGELAVFRRAPVGHCRPEATGTLKPPECVVEVRADQIAARLTIERPRREPDPRHIEDTKLLRRDRAIGQGERLRRAHELGHHPPPQVGVSVCR